MGIRLAFSSNSTIGRQLKHSSTCAQPRGSVYVVNCYACSDVYVGQTGRHTEDRMAEHSRGPYVDVPTGAIHEHQKSNPGHYLNLQSPTEVFSSDCNYTRSTVESALMYVAPTLNKNTASSSTEHNELVAPAICRATKFNWEKLSKCIPHLDLRSVPKQCRYLFGEGDQPVTDPQTSTSQVIPRPPGFHTPVAHRTRTRHTVSLTNENPNTT